MPIFSKTGIRQLRPNNQEVDELVGDSIRRVVLLPKQKPTTRFVDGTQENADYILYCEEGDVFMINDIIKIDYSNLYKGIDYNDESESILLAVVKQPPYLYGTLKFGGRSGEVYLKSLT